MARSKKTTEEETKQNPAESSESTPETPETQEPEKEPVSTDNESVIRILFHGSCPKLSARGVGDLEYEIGIDADQAPWVRIIGNASSGAYSKKWVSLNDVRNLLDLNQEETFKGVILHSLYAGQSNSNIGYLAAVLKAEGILRNTEDQPTALQKGSWDGLMAKIDELNKAGTDLPDPIAQAAKEKEGKKKARSGSQKDHKETGEKTES